jgi:hypothetical protein
LEALSRQAHDLMDSIVTDADSAWSDDIEQVPVFKELALTSGFDYLSRLMGYHFDRLFRIMISADSRHCVLLSNNQNQWAIVVAKHQEFISSDDIIRFFHQYRTTLESWVHLHMTPLMEMLISFERSRNLRHSMTKCIVNRIFGPSIFSVIVQKRENNGVSKWRARMVGHHGTLWLNTTEEAVSTALAWYVSFILKKEIGKIQFEEDFEDSSDFEERDQVRSMALELVADRYALNPKEFAMKNKTQNDETQKRKTEVVLQDSYASYSHYELLDTPISREEDRKKFFKQWDFPELDFLPCLGPIGLQFYTVLGRSTREVVTEQHYFIPLRFFNDQFEIKIHMYSSENCIKGIHKYCQPRVQRRVHEVAVEFSNCFGEYCGFGAVPAVVEGYSSGQLVWQMFFLVKRTTAPVLCSLKRPSSTVYCFNCHDVKDIPGTACKCAVPVDRANGILTYDLASRFSPIWSPPSAVTATASLTQNNPAVAEVTSRNYFASKFHVTGNSLFYDRVPVRTADTTAVTPIKPVGVKLEEKKEENV